MSECKGHSQERSELKLPQSYSIGAASSQNAKRLHLNEFRFKHHPDVLKCLREASERDVIEYTSSDTGESHATLIKSLRRFTGAETIVLAAGSDSILDAVARMSARLGIVHAIGCVPTYTHFINFTEQAGIQFVPVMTGLRCTEDERRELLRFEICRTNKKALVYIVTPNNPTGHTWTKQSVESLIEEFPDSIFLIDEAYTEFEGAATKEGNLNDSSLIGLAQHSNVIVSRTFSKAFGLAGLRIGYAALDAILSKSLTVFINPKSVTSIAAACANVVLDNLSHYCECAQVAIQERRRLCAELQRRKWHVEPGGGNFMLMYAPGLAPKLQSCGVILRDRSDLPSMIGFVRITAGTPEDTTALLSSLDGIAAPTEPPLHTSTLR